MKKTGVVILVIAVLFLATIPLLFASNHTSSNTLNDNGGCSDDIDCNDSDLCTDDSCVNINGDNNGDDGEGGECVNTPINCDDQDICTVDSCNPALGCLNDFFFSCPNCPSELPEITCDDNLDNDCDTFIDCNDPDCANQPTCQECQEPADCDDSNPCTADNCIENTCSNTPISDPDGDGIPSGPIGNCCV